jgi:hypothetical protein
MIKFAGALVHVFSPRLMKARTLYVVVQMGQQIPHTLHPWRGDSMAQKLLGPLPLRATAVSLSAVGQNDRVNGNF